MIVIGLEKKNYITNCNFKVCMCYISDIHYIYMNWATM